MLPSQALQVAASDGDPQEPSGSRWPFLNQSTMCLPFDQPGRAPFVRPMSG